MVLTSVSGVPTGIPPTMTKKKLNYTTAIGATAFISLCYAYPAEHRSPKGGYILVITEDYVRNVDEAGTTMASPLEKADLDQDDGWDSRASNGITKKNCVCFMADGAIIEGSDWLTYFSLTRTNPIN